MSLFSVKYWRYLLLLQLAISCSSLDRWLYSISASVEEAFSPTDNTWRVAMQVLIRDRSAIASSPTDRSSISWLKHAAIYRLGVTDVSILCHASPKSDILVINYFWERKNRWIMFAEAVFYFLCRLVDFFSSSQFPRIRKLLVPRLLF